MRKSISISFSFDFVMTLSSFNLFDIGTNKDYFDLEKSIEDFSNQYNTTFKSQLNSIIKACDNGHSISLYLSTDFIQLLQQADPKVIEELKRAISSKNLEFLGGLDRPSLCSIYSKKQFERSVSSHRRIIKSLFGIEPSTFYNFENIFFAGIGNILSELKFKSTFAGAIDWYLGSSLFQRVFHHPDDEQFKILLVDEDQTKSLFHVDDIKQHFLQFHSQQIAQFEGVDSIISKASYKGKLVSTNKIVASNKSTKRYNIKNPVMGSTQNLMLDSFNGNALQGQILKQYYQLEEFIEATNSDELISLWDKLGHSGYLFQMNVSEVNATQPYSTYNQLNNVLTDLKLKLEA